MLWILLNIYPSSGHLVKKKTSNRDCILGWLKSSCGFSAPSYRNFWASFFPTHAEETGATSFTLWRSACPLNTPLPLSSGWNLRQAGLFGKHVMTAGGRAVPPLRVGPPSSARGGSVSPRLLRLGLTLQRGELRQPTAASPGRKRTCHFKFSAGNWHFIIYVVHVIMLDNITNDAIRSTGNLKWCTPVLTWERSGAHIQPPQLKASSRQRLCPELCSQTDG